MHCPAARALRASCCAGTVWDEEAASGTLVAAPCHICALPAGKIPHEARLGEAENHGAGVRVLLDNQVGAEGAAQRAQPPQPHLLRGVCNVSKALGSSGSMPASMTEGLPSGHSSHAETGSQDVSGQEDGQTWLMRASPSACQLRRRPPHLLLVNHHPAVAVFCQRLAVPDRLQITLCRGQLSPGPITKCNCGP